MSGRELERLREWAANDHPFEGTVRAWHDDVRFLLAALDAERDRFLDAIEPAAVMAVWRGYREASGWVECVDDTSRPIYDSADFAAEAIAAAHNVVCIWGCEFCERYPEDAP